MEQKTPEQLSQEEPIQELIARKEPLTEQPTQEAPLTELPLEEEVLPELPFEEPAGVEAVPQEQPPEEILPQEQPQEEIPQPQPVRQEIPREQPIRQRRPRDQRPPQRRKKRPAPAPQLKIPTFLTELGRDVKWYFDVRLWVPVILVLLILGMCTGSNMGTNKANEENAAAMEALAEEKDQKIQQLTQALALAQQEPEEPTLPYNEEAEALAVLADTVGGGRSDNVKRAIMWVAINRSEDTLHGHGKSLLEEIARPDQWMWYDPEAQYTPATYELALEVLHIRDTGALRPLDGDMLWLVHNDNGSITVRNMFTALAGQKWKEKTIK